MCELCNPVSVTHLWDTGRIPEAKELPALNTVLLDKTMEHVKWLDEARPEREGWNQGEWVTIDQDASQNVCKTSMCFAGWATVLNGDEFDKENIADVCTDEGLLHVSEYAPRILGLHQLEAGALFNGSNSMSDLEAIVARIKEHRGVL